MEHFSQSSVKELLNKHDIKSLKQLGQNFLIDAGIQEKIVRQSGLDNKCGVLEVGPGLGALTTVLCRTVGHVTAVEIDKRLLPLLNDILSGCTNIDVIQGDILKLDLNELVASKMSGFSHHVCANLPYNITSPALAAFIDSDIFETITVMIQKEVAERICARPGTSEYGAFTVFVNYYTSPRHLFDVPPECFYPRPAVTSSVISLEKLKERPLSRADEKRLFHVVRAAFSQRRKTLVNALYASFGSSISKDEISDIVNSCGHDVRIRGERLNIEEFVKLSAFFPS